MAKLDSKVIYTERGTYGCKYQEFTSYNEGDMDRRTYQCTHKDDYVRCAVVFSLSRLVHGKGEDGFVFGVLFSH